MTSTYRMKIHQNKLAPSSMWGVKLGVYYDSESIVSICFAQKNMNSAQNGPTKLGFSDESSLFTVLWGPFLGQRMFFEQNKCLQWIQNHNKPLVWPLTCYLEHIYFGVFSSCMVKSMGHKLSSWKWPLSNGQTLVDFWYVIKYTWYYNNPLRNLLLQFVEGQTISAPAYKYFSKDSLPCNDPTIPL